MGVMQKAEDTKVKQGELGATGREGIAPRRHVPGSPASMGKGDTGQVLLVKCRLAPHPSL